jgi:hypothetical protein
MHASAWVPREWCWVAYVQSSTLIATAQCFAQLLKHLISDGSTLGGQKDSAFNGIGGVWLDRDKAQARPAIPRPVADGVEITGHCRAVDANGASVIVDTFAFVKGNHQKGGHKRQRHRPVQIAQRPERPQEGLRRDLVASRNGTI